MKYISGIFIVVVIALLGANLALNIKLSQTTEPKKVDSATPDTGLIHTRE